MPEIKLDMDKEVGWDLLPGELRALSCGDFDGKDMPLGLPTALRYLADAIEEQVKPAIEEPTEFGSLIRAEAPHHYRALWTPSPTAGDHYWMSEKGYVEVWGCLMDVEVLRVGLGEPPSMTEEEIDESQATAQRNIQKWEPIPNRVRRFCSLRRDCRMSDGHDGGCQP